MPTARGDAAAAPPASSGEPASEFLVAATVSLQERRPHALKHGDTFALFDHGGDALAGPGSPDGIYHRDTRYLSEFHLKVAGARPILLSSAMREDNAMLTCDLTNPDLVDRSGRVLLQHDLIHIRRSRFLWKGALFERLAVRNFDANPHRLPIELRFAADFCDLFEVRGATRLHRGVRHTAEVGADHVTLAYTGLDGSRRETRVSFSPGPTEIGADRALFWFDLGPYETRRIFSEISCDGDPAPPRGFFGALRNSRRALRASSSRAASVTTSNEIFNEAVRRNVSDLYMLITDTPEGPYPYAGIPWFSTVFGRDALITGLQTLWLDPHIARGVLCHLAANQAQVTDPAADAEPGKILHEVRYGEMAELGEVPFRRYYGSVDSTPLFVILAGAYWERTRDRQTIERLWPNIEAALHWIAHDGDRDGDGFVEYGRQASEGLVNQGWKDSSDSVFHANGSLAHGPIAIAEVQAYVFGAWRAAALLARVLHREIEALEYDLRADQLQEEFDDRFFDEDLGTYVLALDGDKNPCRVLSSNAGHALFTGLALPERAASVARRLMERSAFSGWGIRTLATSEARYNPMSYHNGSVWPHDNALIAAGLARYGFRREVARIFEGLFAASTYIDLRRLPELFCGFPRQRSRGPTFYPVACSPQAWSAAAPLSLIQSCLGLGFDVEGGRIVFERPALPDFVDEVVLRRLSIAGGSLDVSLRRAGSEVAVHVLSRRGAVHAMTTS